jgi:hypothetical protein
MADERNSRVAGIMPWPMVMVSVLAMVGAIVVALALIPQLSTRAAYRGGTIAIGTFLGIQIAWRLHARFRGRSGRG